MMDIYRYQFAPTAPAGMIESSLNEAIHAAASLHGESAARLEVRHFLDAASRCCVIDARSSVGDSFNRLFVGQLRRTIGDDGFTVERVPSRSAPAPQMDAMSTTVGGELGR